MRGVIAWQAGNAASNSQDSSSVNRFGRSRSARDGRPDGPTAATDPAHKPESSEPIFATSRGSPGVAMMQERTRVGPLDHADGRADAEPDGAPSMGTYQAS